MENGRKKETKRFSTVKIRLLDFLTFTLGFFATAFFTERELEGSNSLWDRTYYSFALVFLGTIFATTKTLSDFNAEQDLPQPSPSPLSVVRKPEKARAASVADPDRRLSIDTEIKGRGDAFESIELYDYGSGTEFSPPSLSSRSPVIDTPVIPSVTPPPESKYSLKSIATSALAIVPSMLFAGALVSYVQTMRTESAADESSGFRKLTTGTAVGLWLNPSLAPWSLFGIPAWIEEHRYNLLPVLAYYIQNLLRKEPYEQELFIEISSSLVVGYFSYSLMRSIANYLFISRPAFAEGQKRYEFFVMPEDPKDLKLKEGKIYLRKISEGLEYAVISPQGEHVYDRILEARFTDPTLDISELTHILQLKPYYPDIFKILTERGQVSLKLIPPISLRSSVLASLIGAALIGASTSIFEEVDADLDQVRNFFALWLMSVGTYLVGRACGDYLSQYIELHWYKRSVTAAIYGMVLFCSPDLTIPNAIFMGASGVFGGVGQSILEAEYSEKLRKMKVKIKEIGALVPKAPAEVIEYLRYLNIPEEEFELMSARKRRRPMKKIFNLVCIAYTLFSIGMLLWDRSTIAVWRATITATAMPVMLFVFNKVLPYFRPSVYSPRRLSRLQRFFYFESFDLIFLAKVALTMGGNKQFLGNKAEISNVALFDIIVVLASLSLVAYTHFESAPIPFVPTEEDLQHITEFLEWTELEKHLKINPQDIVELSYHLVRFVRENCFGDWKKPTQQQHPNIAVTVAEPERVDGATEFKDNERRSSYVYAGARLSLAAQQIDSRPDSSPANRSSILLEDKHEGKDRGIRETSVVNRAPIGPSSLFIKVVSGDRDRKKVADDMSTKLLGHAASAAIFGNVYTAQTKALFKDFSIRLKP